MVQHLLLMVVAPPLVLMGARLIPLLRGLPRGVARDALGPFLAWAPLRRFARSLTHPVLGWLAMTIAMLGWHVPAAYELALRSSFWHGIEHFSFFTASVLFWWPVVRPWPTRPYWPAWSLPPFLLAGDMVNTTLAAFLAFSDRLLYPIYADVPRLFGLSASEDQVLAGALMWVVGSFFFLVPAVAITARLLSPRGLVPTLKPSRPAPARSVLLPVVQPAGFDLLRVPVVGGFLRSNVGHRALQGVLLLVVLVVVVDGLYGQPMGAMNLAGVLPWTYWRGLVVLGLLAAGNFFCMACPFLLPREIARQLGKATRPWPRALRSKWLAVILLAAFFWAYEVFDLWDSPVATAGIVITYFAGVLVVDSLFRGASFCKYLCPIGQFNFLGSTFSSLEVKVRRPEVCASCKTRDCIRGNERSRGCELDLYLPTKAGNLDCTFCLDCVRACPHDNIGLVSVAPWRDLARDPMRSSIGRLSRRPDLAALALVFTFAALGNAAAMAAPVTAFVEALAARLGLSSTWPVLTGSYLLFLLLGSVLVASAVASGRAAAHLKAPLRSLFCRFALALIPLGLTVWAAHFLFHLLSGWRTAWPAAQQAALDLGFYFLGAPFWSTSSVLGVDSLLSLRILLLDAGLLLSLYVGWRAALDFTSRQKLALPLMTPWALIAILLYGASVWVFLQPMEMRGMVH